MSLSAPLNHGKPWNAHEDRKLLKAVRRDRSLPILSFAVHHGRTASLGKVRSTALKAAPKVKPPKVVKLRKGTQVEFV